jgi:hypothetical protein
MASSIFKQATIIIVSLATGAGSMALATSKSTEKPGVSTAGPPNAKPKRSEGRAARVRNADVAIRDLPSGSVMAPPVATGAVDRKPDPADSHTLGAASAEAEEAGVTNFERTEDEFSVETRDPRWAADSESAIVTIAQRFPETRSSDVECRTKHCRMVVSFPGVEEYNALFRGIAEDATLKQSGMIANIEDNKATIYISRAGSDASAPDSRAN